MTDRPRHMTPDEWAALRTALRGVLPAMPGAQVDALTDAVDISIVVLARLALPRVDDDVDDDRPRCPDIDRACDRLCHESRPLVCGYLAAQRAHARKQLEATLEDMGAHTVDCDNPHAHAVGQCTSDHADRMRHAVGCSNFNDHVLRIDGIPVVDVSCCVVDFAPGAKQ